MAERWMTSLCEMPFSVTRELMLTLDTENGWEQLALAADFNFETIQLFQLERQRSDGSPTRKLLWELGCQGYSVADLYEKLQKARRAREAKVLERYANAPEPSGGKRGAYAMPSKGDPDYLRSLISQLSSSGLNTNKPGVSSSGSSNGSSTNFNINHASPHTHSNANGSKHYDDKVIPGGDGVNTVQSKLASITTSASQDSGHSFLPPSHLHGDPSTPVPSTGKVSLPSAVTSYDSSYSDNIKRYLRTPQPPSATHFPPSPSEYSSAPDPLDPQGATGGGPGLSVSRFDSTGSRPRSGGSDDFVMSVKATYSLQELHQGTDGFAAHNLLGEGTFGMVYKSRIRHQDCAVKKMKQAEDTDKSEQLRKELTTLMKYQHDNIVILYGYAQENSELCLVYQYLPHGSLEDRLALKNGTDPLTWDHRLNIMVGSARGLNFLHTMGHPPLIHGDIKSANILLDKNFEAKIADLGQSQYATATSSTSTDTKSTPGFTCIPMEYATSKQFGSKPYLAPDVISNRQLSTKSDVFALGVVYLEVCTGLKAYYQNRRDPFLHTHVKTLMADMQEEGWVEQFQDRKANHLPPDIFVDMMKIAKKCITDMKKRRPDSVKMLNEIETVYKKYVQSKKDVQAWPSSLQDSNQSSSLQISSTSSPRIDCQPNSLSPSQTSSLHMAGPNSYPSSLQEGSVGQPNSLQQAPSESSSLQAGSSHSCYQSHSSQGQMSADLMAAPSSATIDHSQIWAESSHQQRQRQPVEGTGCPDSPLSSFPVGGPLPESLRLQMAYDKQTERKKIDRLSEMIPGPSEKMVNQSMDNVNYSTQADQSGDSDISYFPPADPKKLAELNAYDQENSGTRESDVDSNFKVFPSDPKKMAMLQGFDVGSAGQNEAPENSNISDSINRFDKKEVQEDHELVPQQAETAAPTNPEPYGNDQLNLYQDDRRNSDIDNNAVGEESPVQDTALAKRNNLIAMYAKLAQQIQNEGGGEGEGGTVDIVDESCDPRCQR